MFPLALTVALLTQLLWSAASEILAHKKTCEDARLKCAYRTGCGMALQNYIVECSTVLRDNAKTCPEVCQHALIALTSTDEGKDLITCECADEFCHETKERVEVCRPHVTHATHNESIVSCRVAQWICAADGVCSTALEYYHRYCRSMFHGRKCSNRCKNSISILRRQEKAAKLDTCICDGREEYNCAEIRNNMARLCYHKEPEPAPEDIEVSNEVPARGSVESSATSVMPMLSLLFLICFFPT